MEQGISRPEPLLGGGGERVQATPPTPAVIPVVTGYRPTRLADGAEAATVAVRQIADDAAAPEAPLELVLSPSEQLAATPGPAVTAEREEPATPAGEPVESNAPANAGTALASEREAAAETAAHSAEAALAVDEASGPAAMAADTAEGEMPAFSVDGVLVPRPEWEGAPLPVELETATIAAAAAQAGGAATRARPARLVARGPLPQVRSLATWLLVVRPHALLFAVAPVIVALAALAAQGARVRWSLGVAAVLAIGLAQAGCSAIDAYVEHQRRQRALRGGEAAIANTPSPLMAHGIYPLEALWTGCVFLVAAGLAATPLVVVGGVPVLALGVCGAGAGLLYSATPYALKFYPVGDLLLFLGLGPGIVAVVALSQRHPISSLLLVLGVVLGLYMLASVFAAHLRDTARLRALGRRTLAGVLSEQQVRLACALCVAVPYVALLAIGLPVGHPHPLLLVFLSLPAAVLAVTGALRAAPVEPLELVVRQLGRAYALFALWLVIGLAVMALWINLP